MFFQVLFAKTCSMKFSKRLEDRWIFASSGTVPFWRAESPPPGGRMFFQVVFEKTCSMTFAKRLEDDDEEIKEEKEKETAQPVQA